MDFYINFNRIIRKRNLLAHIYIWTIAVFILVLSTTIFNGNLIGIIYSTFFLSFVLLYQTKYSVWARCVRAYCYVLSMYSITICILTYSYQFTSVSAFFKQFLTEQILNDLGFVTRDQAYMIFLEPFLPLTMAILSFFYLKLFREDFNRFAYLAEEDDLSLSTPLNDSNINLNQEIINDNSTIILLGPTSTATVPKTSTSTSDRQQQQATGAYGGLQDNLKDQSERNLSSSQQQTQFSNSRLELSKKSKRAKFGKFCSIFFDVIMRTLDSHLIKLVAFMIFRLPIVDLCLMNLPFLFIVICILKYPSTSKCSTLVASWLISFIILARQVAKLNTLEDYDLVKTCPADAPEELAGKSESYLTYIGIKDEAGNPINRVDNHIYVLLFITLYSFISLHYRRKIAKSKIVGRTYESEFNIIFTGIGRREADESLWNLIQYFCNFGFYKFGIEVTCLALIIAISNRLDVIAAIYAIILTLLCITTSKKTLASIWPILTLIVSLLIPIQLILILGIPKPLCLYYPWSDMSDDFRYWLYLPDYKMSQDKMLLMYDFIVLLMVCRQAVVLKLITITSGTSFVINQQIHHNFSAHQFKLRYLPDEEGFAVEDCFSNNSTPSSFLKSFFFISTFWITLAVVLVAGATKISLFSLGYLIGCFIFLWLGNDAYLMPLRRLIFSWNCFIFYAALVIFTKVILQLYACYMHTYLLNHCYVLQLLRIVCYRKMQPQPTPTDNAGQCAASLPYDELDILWDGLCLMFLLLQRVVFGSQYFRYLVQEVKAQQILASRGAELIMATKIEEAKAQALLEKQVMRNIRAKMDDLKTDDEETSNAWQRLLSLPHHHQVIRNADRHLFSGHEDSVAVRRTDDWKFKKAFIPDPLGDELERMAEINGITAVFTRWMKSEKLYGHFSNGSGTQINNNVRNPQASQQQSPGESAQMIDRGETDTTRLQTEPDPRADDIFVQSASVVDREGDYSERLMPDTDEQREEARVSAAQSYDIIPSDDDEESSSSNGDGGRFRKFLDMLNLIFYSILLSSTVELNKLSRSYRYVSRRMAVEKNALKKHFNLNDERFKRDQAWRKWVISTLSDTYVKTTEYNQGAQSNTSLHRIRSALKIMTGNASSSTTGYNGYSATQSQDSQHSPHSEPASPRSQIQDANQQQVSLHKSQYGAISTGGGSGKTSEPTDPEYHFLKLNIFTQFCRALAYVFVSNTSLICQLVIVLNQIETASLLSLPLPLLTFLWGTLSVPRPTKRFWKIVITYTELVIVFKYVFQFPIWDWDTNNIKPFYYPNLLGIKNITITYDLTLLLVLFLHRSMLKSLGQWDASGSGDEVQQFMLVDVQQEQSTTRKSPPSSHSPSSVRSERREVLPSSSHSFQRKSRSDEKVVYDTSTQDVQMRDSDNKLSEPSVENSYQNQTIELVADKDQPQLQDGGNGLESGNCLVRSYNRMLRSITLFFQHVLNTPHKVQTDVYTWMFLCDFINFLILIYGFWAFGSGYTNQTISSFLNENRIPFSVLIMLLAQFASIMIDRAFYLQKNITGKLTFQVILVTGIHFWLFFALPFATGHALTLKEYWPPKAWYVFKCIYFLLSAHQIRSGYPRRVLGNCFTKGYGYANWGAFKVYRAIPLVYDLRLYMDWIWTQTTLEFRNWSLMEDMFANLFIRKCELTLEEEYPIPRAKPIKHLSKYLTGGAFILLILAIIWGPLLLFSMGKTVGESNPPVEMEFELEIVGFQPILRMRATTQQITTVSASQYDRLKNKFVSLPSQSFLGDYKLGDVAVIRLDGQSNAVWEISPPSKESLTNRISQNETFTLKSSWKVFRIKKAKSQSFDASISGSYQQVILRDENQAFRTSLSQMLNDSSTTLTPMNETKFVITPTIFPNYLRVPETGQSTLVDQFDDNVENQTLRSLRLSYIRMFDTNIQQIDNTTSWWRADDLCKYDSANDSFPFWSSSTATGDSVLEHCDSLIIVTFNDRIFTGLLALLSAPGIIGLYTTFVVFFARLIRSEPSGKVIYSEIPNVDRVYGLIMDIYMARECNEFELEEKLYSKLLFLYRSPEMLIELSRREDEPPSRPLLEQVSDDGQR